MTTPSATSPIFADAELVDFIEGRADATLAARITATIDGDPDLAERIAGLDPGLPVVALAFDRLLHSAPRAVLSDALAAAATQHATRPSLEPAASAATRPAGAAFWVAMAFVAGFLLAWGLQEHLRALPQPDAGQPSVSPPLQPGSSPASVSAPASEPTASPAPEPERTGSTLDIRPERKEGDTETPVASAGSQSPEALSRSETPTSSPNPDTPVAVADSDAPEALSRSENPISSPDPDTPVAVAGSDTVATTPSAETQTSPLPAPEKPVGTDIAAAGEGGSSERLGEKATVAPDPTAQVAAAIEVTPPWVEAVASYMRLFTAETLLRSARPLRAMQRELAKLGTRFDLDLQSLSNSIPGLTLQRVDLLELRGRPLLQLAYTDRDGSPVAVCLIVRPADAGSQKASGQRGTLALRRHEVHGLKTVEWDRPRLGLLVMGRASADRLSAAARIIDGLI